MWENIYDILLSKTEKEGYETNNREEFLFVKPWLSIYVFMYKKKADILAY